MLLDRWRRQLRGLDVVMRDDLPEAREALRGADAAQKLDAWEAVADWAEMAMDPEIRAMAALMHEVTASIRRGDTDGSGRAVAAGRILGIQPPGPATAGPLIARGQRDRAFRSLRAAIPEWHALSDRAAAAVMLARLDRYRLGGWQADRELGVVPQDEPRRGFYLLLKIEGKTKLDLGTERLAAILGADEYQPETVG